MLERLFGRAEPQSQQPWFEIGSAQWQGTRETQNDVMFHPPWDPQRGVLFGLADGLGIGREAGAAARAAAEAIRQDYLEAPLERELHHQLLRMIGSAHANVRGINNSLRQSGEPPTGASVAAVLIRGDEMSFASVGNVRVFLLRRGLLLQLNRDDLLSLEAEERDILSGEPPSMEPEWAMTVTAYAGMEGLKKVDFQQTPIRLQTDDRIVVMSSGLYGILPENELIACLEMQTPSEAAQQVIDRVRANCQGSQSNTSLVVLRINRRRRALRQAAGVTSY